jgi:TRAP-type C4-dicarboxylate transport system permease small subunit
MLRVIDRISGAASFAASWAYFVVGLMLAFEVVARYFFNAPTIWAEELSRLIFIWATLIAAAALLRDDQHIRVTILTDKLGEPGQRAARAISLLAVLGVSALMVIEGAHAPLDSFARGRTSGTMMDVPAWWFQASVPLAFLLVCLQAAAELIRTLAGAALPEHEDVSE